MALNVQQLLHINFLLYSRSPSIYKGESAEDFCGRTLGEFARCIDPSTNRNGTSDEAEWAHAAARIAEDAVLNRVRIIDSYRDADTGEAACFLIDEQTDEAIVAFRGTGKGEWKDNFIAGAHMDHDGADPTVSPQQQKALEYLRRVEQGLRGMLTLTGHSKGGNKAKLCALLDDRVDRCVSFDGQGFSDEFFSAHAGQIAKNAHKIENHNVAGDFVNILLNDVGRTTYYKGHRVHGNFWKNHDPSAFLSDDGSMEPDEQNMEMIELDLFLNSMLRCAQEKKKIALLSFAGDVTSALRGTDASRRRLMDVLCDSVHAEQFSYMLAYMLKYEHETSRITDAVELVLDRMGLSDLRGLIAAISDLAHNELSFGIFHNLLKLCDDIPDWIVRGVREKLIDDGSPLLFADTQIKHFLRIIARAGEQIDEIEVRRDSGYDLVMPDAADGLAAGIEFARRMISGGQ